MPMKIVNTGSYTAAQRARLKPKHGTSARHQRLIKYRMTDVSRCRRAADAPSVTGFAKVSGCLLTGSLKTLNEVGQRIPTLAYFGNKPLSFHFGFQAAFLCHATVLSLAGKQVHRSSIRCLPRFLARRYCFL